MFSTGIDNLAPTAGESGLSPGPEESGLLSSGLLIKSEKNVNASVEPSSFFKSPPMFVKQNAAIDLYISVRLAFGPLVNKKALEMALFLVCIPPILIFKSPG